jgi:hypothetical protein
MTTTRTHFTFHVDMWTPGGESIVEHVAEPTTAPRNGDLNECFHPGHLS